MRALIVDGYNIIHAWPSLNLTMRTRGLEDARRQLVTALAEYAAQTGVAVTVVFDGQARPGGLPTNEHQRRRHRPLRHQARRARTTSSSAPRIRPSQRGEGADVVVATDDRLERDVVGGDGGCDHGSARARDRGRARRRRVNTETRRMRDDSRRTTRVEDGLDPEVRAPSRAHPSRRGSLKPTHLGRSVR